MLAGNGAPATSVASSLSMLRLLVRMCRGMAASLDGWWVGVGRLVDAGGSLLGS